MKKKVSRIMIVFAMVFSLGGYYLITILNAEETQEHEVVKEQDVVENESTQEQGSTEETIVVQDQENAQLDEAMQVQETQQSTTVMHTSARESIFHTEIIKSNDHDYLFVYANGHNVVIEQQTDNNTYAVNALDKNDKVMVNNKSYLFAGSREVNGNYDATTIEMNSGEINTIVGSNRQAGRMGNVNLIINGGKVSMVIGNQGANPGTQAFMNNSGAANYASRKEYSVDTLTITMNGGTAGALAGTFGYTYTKNVNITVNGGSLAATTSPMQSGIIGGTNGEIENLVIHFNGGTTKDISLSQRTMITTKATVNVQGGNVGNIYAGSYYDDGDNADGTNIWGTWGAGSVNYGQAKAIDITVGKVAIFNDIYAGFQYVDKAKFMTKYGTWISNIEGSESAPIKIVLHTIGNYAIQNTTHCKSLITSPLSSAIETLTLIKEDVAPEVFTPPIFDATKPVNDVTVGLSNQSSVDTLKAAIANIISNVSNAVGMDATTKENVQKALLAGKTINIKAVMDKVSSVSEKENTMLQNKVKSLKEEPNVSDVKIAQLFDLSVVLETDTDRLGNVSELNDAIQYTVAVPNDLLEDNRTFSVLRIHGDNIEKLPTTYSQGTVTFLTDRYSTYALIYTDSKTPSPSPVNPGTSGGGSTGGSKPTGTVTTNEVVSTGDSTYDTTPYFFALVLASTAIGLIILKKLRTKQ